jgi:hypothetical protein
MPNENEDSEMTESNAQIDVPSFGRDMQTVNNSIKKSLG